MTRKGFFARVVGIISGVAGGLFISGWLTRNKDSTDISAVTPVTAEEGEDILSDVSKRHDVKELDHIYHKLHTDYDYRQRVLAMAVFAEAKWRYGTDANGVVNETKDPWYKPFKDFPKDILLGKYLRKHHIFCYEPLPGTKPNTTIYQRIYMNIYTVDLITGADGKTEYAEKTSVGRKRIYTFKPGIKD